MWFLVCSIVVEYSSRCTFDAECSVTVGLNKDAHKVQFKMSADTRISTDTETQRGRAQIGRYNYSKV